MVRIYIFATKSTELTSDSSDAQRLSSENRENEGCPRKMKVILRILRIGLSSLSKSNEKAIPGSTLNIAPINSQIKNVIIMTYFEKKMSNVAGNDSIIPGIRPIAHIVRSASTNVLDNPRERSC